MLRRTSVPIISGGGPRNAIAPAPILAGILAVRSLWDQSFQEKIAGSLATLRLRQQVAIKIVKRGMDTDFILRRFRNERQILAGLEMKSGETSKGWARLTALRGGLIARKAASALGN